MVIDFLMQRRSAGPVHRRSGGGNRLFPVFSVRERRRDFFSRHRADSHLERGETVLPPRRTPKTHFHVRVKGRPLLDLQILFSRIFAASKLWVFFLGSVQSV